MQIRYLSALKPGLIPWGPDDGDDDTGAGGDGSQGSGEQGQSGGDRATPLTEEGLERLLDSRLGPIENEVRRFGNFQGQVRRHLGLGDRNRNRGGDDQGDEGRDDRGQGNDDRDRRREGGKKGELSDAEKRANAAERRWKDLEEKAERSQVRADLRDALDGYEDKLVKGARAKIERILGSGLRVVDGKTVYDNGEEIVDLEEIVKTEASDPLYLKASKKKPGGREEGEAEGNDRKPKGWDDLDLESMSDDEFEKLEGRLEEGWRRPK